MSVIEPTEQPAPLQRSRVIERSPVYYGWVVVAAATLGLMMTQPGQTAGVSVFLDGIIADLGLSRSVVSLLYTAGTLAGSFALPYAGRFIDRRGPRVAVTVIAALFALACVWMGGVVRGLLTLFIGFVLIRSLGQGALSLVSFHVVNLWFVRRRGLAVGLLGIGGALSTAIFPPVIEFLLQRLGWRLAYMALGGVVATTILPLGWLLFRGEPERFGLTPDGRATRDEAVSEVNLTVEEARRSPIFWLFASGHFLVAGLATGLLFHHYDIMATNGLARAIAALVFVPLGLLSALGNIVFGALMDRVSPRYLQSSTLGLLALALLLATRATRPEIVLVYGGLLGLSLGATGSVQGSVYAHYFGRRQIGAIRGLATTIAVAGAAFGPFLFALGPDYLGGYAPVLTVSILPLVGLALAALLISEPGSTAG